MTEAEVCDVRIHLCRRSCVTRSTPSCFSEGLPILRAWLIEREVLHGRFGHDWIRVLFDTEAEKLQYQRA